MDRAFRDHWELWMPERCDAFQLLSIHSIKVKPRTAMDLFQSIRKFWQTMGIKPSDPNQVHPFNARNLFFISSLIMICISTTAFLIFRAETLLEYGSCLYWSLSEHVMLVNILIDIWRIPIIFKMIEACERFIEMSKLTFFQWRNLLPKEIQKFFYSGWKIFQLQFEFVSVLYCKFVI